MNMLRVLSIYGFSAIFNICHAQNCEWAIGFGGSSYDFPFALEVDYSGDAITMGRVNNTIDFNPNGTPYEVTGADEDVYIAKHDPSGELVWVKIFPSYAANGTNLTSDAFGNVFAAGSFSENMHFDPDSFDGFVERPGAGAGFLLKLNEDGDFQWVKIIDGVGDPIGAMQPEGLDIDTEGNLFLTGNFSRGIDFDPGLGSEVLTSLGGHDFFVEKFDSDGNFLWVNHYESLTGSWEKSVDLKVTHEGDVLVLGTFSGEVDFDARDGVENYNAYGNDGCFTLKLDNDGEYIWVSTIMNETDLEPRHIESGDDGEVYISGYFEDEMDFDPSEDELIINGAGWKSLFIEKLSSSGEFLWASPLQISDQGLNAHLYAHSSGNLAVFGSFQGTIDMDPREDTEYEITSVGQYDVFFSILDSDGQLVSAVSMGGPENDFARGIDMTNTGHFYLTGSFHETVDFQPGPAVLNRTSNGGKDGFLLKMSSFLSAEEIFIAEKYTLYPNPARNICTISGIESGIVSVYDQAGKIILVNRQVQHKLELDLSRFKAGVYFLHIENDEGLFIEKLIVY